MLWKFRADESDPPCKNGAVAWWAKWLMRSLSLVRNCPTPMGPRTVYASGEPDTYFSIPAACHFRKRTIRGFLTCTEDDGGWRFHPYAEYGCLEHKDCQDHPDLGKACKEAKDGARKDA